MASVSHKLDNSIEGAMAGGGDPATSPLYVFGPFLRLIVVAGVAAVTFGATIWLVVFTIAMVSAMYRMVMIWVTDGSGGSGLSEEEFGGWAVKVNAGITIVEYTLTFLVSMAAMVTFIADRFPLLNESIFGIQYNTFVAIFLSILTGWLVNRGPKAAARAFGPATAGVLILLWAMVFSTIIQYGFNLPDFKLEAFSSEYIKYTFGGFTRMLAVMTGIEVFANLVAAYSGKPRQRSNKAFGSLLIIMGTTAVVMLILGPAIRDLSSINNTDVSVFTQAMDELLPQPLAYAGTIVGVAVLLSASAAASQGIQNLFLGLRDRNYIPAFLGEQNHFNVADKPVWGMVGLICLVFLVSGTDEEKYLALYAAGVFILLSMTGWAVSKRLLRILRGEFSSSNLLSLVGTVFAATITTAATIVIFEERFLDGAWTYLIFIPLLYLAFSYFRTRLGAPTPGAERLGELEAGMMGGFGFGQTVEVTPAMVSAVPTASQTRGQAEVRPTPIASPWWQGISAAPHHILVPLDGSQFAEHSLPAAEVLGTAFNSQVTLLSVARNPQEMRNGGGVRQVYLDKVSMLLKERGINSDTAIRFGSVPSAINLMVTETGVDLVVISTHGRSGIQRWLLGSVANRIIQLINCPVLVIHPREGITPPVPEFRKLLVALDGSKYAERVLPYVKSSSRFESVVLLLSVPYVPQSEQFGAAVDEIEKLRLQAVGSASEYLEEIACVLEGMGVHTEVLVTGSRPAQTIINVAQEQGVDVIMMATHGRGTVDRLYMGSVADRVIHHTSIPVFLVPIQERRRGNASPVFNESHQSSGSW